MRSIARTTVSGMVTATVGMLAGAIASGLLASAAHASATVDLIWIDKSDSACLDATRRDCPQLGNVISSVAVSDNITLGVLITAGPHGILLAGVSVNYGDTLPILSVAEFRSLTTPVFLPLRFRDTTDQPPFIDNINAVSADFLNVGIGLPPGRTAYLGTVTFHADLPIGGTFEIGVGVDGPGGTDAISDLEGALLSHITTYNFAFVSDGLPTPTPTATPTSTPVPTPTATPTATPTRDPARECELTWESRSISTIGKSDSWPNNLKVSHFIRGHIVDPSAICPVDEVCTAHRIPVCAGSRVEIRVFGAVENSNTGKGDIFCISSGCLVEAIEGVEKYKSISFDGTDTDQITLIPE